MTQSGHCRATPSEIIPVRVRLMHLLRSLNACWQDHLEYRSMRVTGRSRWAPAMSFDDGSTNRQSHSHAMVLGSKKTVEHAPHVLRFNSNARVAHHDLDAFGVVNCGFDT